MIASEDKSGGTIPNNEHTKPRRSQIIRNIITRIQNILASFKVNIPRKVVISLREGNSVCSKAELGQVWLP